MIHQDTYIIHDLLCIFENMHVYCTMYIHVHCTCYYSHYMETRIIRYNIRNFFHFTDQYPIIYPPIPKQKQCNIIEW